MLEKVPSTIAWECPSNIALVKYWGKFEGQIPANPSLSFTLSSCVTQTYLSYQRDVQAPLNFLFDGQPKPTFETKIQAYLNSLHDVLPWLKNTCLKIESHNTFPHSSGIASSASAMGALALGLVSVDRAMKGGFDPRDVSQDAAFWRQASDLARRGSGSACRSVFGGFTVWGQHQDVEGSDDRWAVPLGMDQIHPTFHDIQDVVLLVDRGEKSVSSSAGHGLMNQHPYAEARFKQGKERVGELNALLNSASSVPDDERWWAFGDLVESEALTLHAMMLCSRPSYLLMKPKTLEILEQIRRFRNQKKVPLFFTLDAGANVHLLFPANAQNDAMELLDKQIAPILGPDSYLWDRLGAGPRPLTLPS
jgi:diphosphomevalonate decarboxylase